MIEQGLNSRLNTRHRLMAYGELFPEITQKLSKMEYLYYIKYTEGLTLAEIGALYNTTPQQVRQILVGTELKFKQKAREIIETCKKLKHLISNLL